ncbi:MAG: NAD(P)H-dependent oxidoreductase [Candidatus Gracilibacteria bacterium]|nr:NAD(P)H-dependent oxidoreductase [Candidatus Gracilibacteria bacterium]
MKKLHIIASPRGERSKSKMLGEYVLSKMTGEKETLDLNAVEVPFLTNGVIAYDYGFALMEDLSVEDKKIATIQNKFVKQILEADEIVISAPLWNFSLPAILKAYFDLILKMGDTVKMEDGNFVGLTTNVKKAYLVLTKGGFYEGHPWQSIDMIESLIRQDLNFIGITNIEVITLEGANRLDEETLESKVEELKMQIDSKL